MPEEIVKERWWYVRSMGTKYVIKSELFVRHDEQHLFKASGAKSGRKGWRNWFPSREEALSEYLKEMDRLIESSRADTERRVKEREKFAAFVAKGGVS
jgi:hypothetical protein